MIGKIPAQMTREKRDAFRKAVDRRAQIVPAQDQDGGKEACAVGDADPPGIVDEIEAPNIGDVHPPDADADDRDGKQRIAEERDEPAGRPGARATTPNRSGERVERRPPGSSLHAASLLIRLSVLLRVFDTREVGGARLGVQRSQKRVVARAPL